MKFQDLINSNLFAKYCRNLFDNRYDSHVLVRQIRKEVAPQ